MNASTLGLRIERLRLEKKLSKKELAKVIGVSGTTIGQWEKGEVVPRDDKVNRLAQYFNVSFEWLRVGVDSTLVSNVVEGKIISIRPYVSSLPDLFFDLRELPKGHSNHLMYVKMDGDNGGDILPNNSTLIIDVKDNNIKDGKIYFFEYQGYHSVRKVSFTSTGVRLCPLDLTKGRDELVTFQTLSQFKIVGRIVMSSSFR